MVILNKQIKYDNIKDDNFEHISINFNKYCLNYGYACVCIYILKIYARAIKE